MSVDLLKTYMEIYVQIAMTAVLITGIVVMDDLSEKLLNLSIGAMLLIIGFFIVQVVVVMCRGY